MNIEELITVIVNDYLWGTPMVAFILLAGAYITVRTGFFQIRGFKMAMKRAWNNFFGKNKDDENAGVLSPLEAMATALGTTIGVGNIGGVASAVAIGGPGAIFWMWISGLFGMVIKSAEITLAVHYRSKDENNEAYGGPNYYMQKGIGMERGKKKLFKVLSALFIVGFSMSYFINIQTYTVSEAMSSTFGIGMIASALVFTVLLYIMISGGMKSVGRWATLLVPFMCMFYIIGGLIIIAKNIDVIPGIFGMIFSTDDTCFGKGGSSRKTRYAWNFRSFRRYFRDMHDDSSCSIVYRTVEYRTGRSGSYFISL